MLFLKDLLWFVEVYDGVNLQLKIKPLDSVFFHQKQDFKWNMCCVLLWVSLHVIWNACVCPRLAEECASEPVLMKNPFTSPYKHKCTEDSLEFLCQSLLHCCDSVWIPTVLVRLNTNLTCWIDLLFFLLNFCSLLVINSKFHLFPVCVQCCFGQN